MVKLLNREPSFGVEMVLVLVVIMLETLVASVEILIWIGFRMVLEKLGLAMCWFSAFIQGPNELLERSISIPPLALQD